MRKGAVRSSEVRDGSLFAGDFAVGQLPKGEKGETGPPGPAGPSTGAAGGDLTGNYPDPSIRANAVDSASVADGSLTTDDVVKEAGTFPLNLGSTAAHSCAESDVQFIESGGALNTADNDPIAITPSAAWTGVGGTFTYHTRHVGGARNGFRIVMCNISGSAVDPPAIDFHWVIFNRP